MYLTMEKLHKNRPFVLPLKPVSNISTEVTGTTEAGAIVTVTIGTTKYTATAASADTFKVTIPLQKVGTQLTVTATDAAGNVSPPITVTVQAH